MEPWEPADIELAFVPNILTKVSLPYKSRGEAKIIRKNGDLTCIVESENTVPSGVYPRLILMYCATAVKAGLPEYDPDTRRLSLPESPGSFCGKLGGSRGGKQTMVAVRQLSNLLETRFDVTDCDGRYAFTLCDDYSISWLECSDDESDCHMTLSQEFVDDITRNAVPVDRGTSLGLGSVMSLDIYWWLGRRYYYLDEPCTIPWKSLQEQFGGARPLPNFKQNFTIACDRASRDYPEARFAFTSRGIRLQPSPTPVPPELCRRHGPVSAEAAVRRQSRGLNRPVPDRPDKRRSQGTRTKQRPVPTEATTTRIVNAVCKDPGDVRRYLQVRSKILDLWRKGMDEMEIICRLTIWYTDNKHTLSSEDTKKDPS